MGEGISIHSLLADLGNVVWSPSRVWSEAPGENEFSAFFATQYTSGQVLIERSLPPKVQKVAPSKK